MFYGKMENHWKHVTKKPRSITVNVKKIILFTPQTSFVPDSILLPFSNPPLKFRGI